MGAPAMAAGAVHRTVAVVAEAAVAAPIVGRPDTTRATLFELADAALVPTMLAAVTVKWYVCPAVSPVTSRLVVPAADGRNAPI